MFTSRQYTALADLMWKAVMELRHDDLTALVSDHVDIIIVALRMAAVTKLIEGSRLTQADYNASMAEIERHYPGRDDL